MVAEVWRPRRRPVAKRESAAGRLIGTGRQRQGQVKAGPDRAMAAGTRRLICDEEAQKSSAGRPGTE